MHASSDVCISGMCAFVHGGGRDFSASAKYYMVGTHRVLCIIGMYLVFACHFACLYTVDDLIHSHMCTCKRYLCAFQTGLCAVAGFPL